MLEQIYGAVLIEKKTALAFILGLSYSILGIFSALVIFADAPGLAAVAFTSLLLLPSLNNMLAIESTQAGSIRKFTFWRPFRAHKDIFKAYFFIFLGVFLAFSIFSLTLPNLASGILFERQLQAVGITGNALGPGAFYSIIFNNLIVISFMLIASLFYGAGSVFLLVWNASVWGTVIGIFARNSTLNVDPTIVFGAILLAIFPHLAAEATAYLMAAVSGGIVSKAVISTPLLSERFRQILKDALLIFGISLLVLLLAAYLEVNFGDKIFQLFGI